MKYHENTWSPNLKEIISSYHLKTIAFWHFEKTSPESCTEETLDYHLVKLLEELAEALRLQNIPMCFTPKVILLQDVGDPEVLLDLMGKVLQLSHNFSAITKSVDNKSTFGELLLFPKTDSTVHAKILSMLRGETWRKTEEDEENGIYEVRTLSDLFAIFNKRAKKSNNFNAL